MIINVDYIRRYRPLAKNICDERVAVYIREAEHIDILPAIGAELYKKFSQLGDIIVDNERLMTEGGGPIYALAEGELPTEEYKLLNGGYYNDSCGEEQYFHGLKAALAYLAYARFVRNHSTNVTVYGVVIKTGEDSTPADARTISAAALDAQRIGEDYLAAAVRYWKYATECACGGQSAARPRFMAIGD